MSSDFEKIYKEKTLDNAIKVFTELIGDCEFDDTPHLSKDCEILREALGQIIARLFELQDKVKK